MGYKENDWSITDVLKEGDTLDFNDEAFIHWENYKNPLYDKYNQDQERYIKRIPVRLEHNYLGFIYLSKFADMEELLNKQLTGLRVMDHEVSMCNEVFYTTKIEGAVTTLKRTQSIHHGAFPTDYSEQMVFNSFRATKYMNLVNGAVTKDTICKCWNILIDKACDNEEIRGETWRTDSNRIGEHLGMPVEVLDEKMSQYVDFYNSELLNDHPFIKAALLHYLFEYIHPFPDGNGRMGRLLMNNYLIYHCDERMKAVSFSKSIDKIRKGYDVAFINAENDREDCTPFVAFMLECFYDALMDAVQERDC